VRRVVQADGEDDGRLVHRGAEGEAVQGDAVDISGGVSHTRKEFVAPSIRACAARGRIEKRRHGGDVSGGDDDDQLRIVRLGQTTWAKRILQGSAAR
jgi:hypothetical protein